MQSSDKQVQDEIKEQEKKLEKKWFSFMDRYEIGIQDNPFLTEALHRRRNLWCPEILQSNQLRSMVLSGIPHCLRGIKNFLPYNRKFILSCLGSLWQIFIGSVHNFETRRGDYQRILHHHVRDSSIATSEIERVSPSFPYKVVIISFLQKDLNRTFPEHQYYRDPTKGQIALKNVLTAYSWTNPFIGYCQSMVRFRQTQFFER